MIRRSASTRVPTSWAVFRSEMSASASAMPMSDPSPRYASEGDETRARFRCSPSPVRQISSTCRRGRPAAGRPGPCCRGLLWPGRWYRPRRRLRRYRRHLVTTVSTAGLKIVPAQAVYAATKNAVRTLLEGLRQESTDGVLRTTAVSPGFVRTELADSIDNPKSASRSAAAATSSPSHPTPSPLPSSSLMRSRLATSPSVRRPRLASEDHGGLRVAVCGREDQVWGRRHRS
jgi:NAD(P)-dependent dehydrogenase (short-subunit alcohol dehydrogenase family)